MGVWKSPRGGWEVSVIPINRKNHGMLGLAAAAGFILLQGFRTTAQADVYYWKDKDGVFHFTNTARPHAQPFIVDEPLARLRADDVSDRVPDSPDYDTLIGKLAKQFRVEKALVKAVIRAES